MEKITVIITSVLLSFSAFSQDLLTKEIKSDSEKEAYAVSYHIQARTEAENGQYERAFQSIDKALLLSPENVAHMTFKAIMIMRNTLEKDQALPLLDQVVSKTSYSSEAFYYRGLSKKQQNDLVGACQDFEIAAQLNYPLAEGSMGKYCKTRVLDILATVQ